MAPSSWQHNTLGRNGIDHIVRALHATRNAGTPVASRKHYHFPYTPWASRDISQEQFGALSRASARSREVGDEWGDKRRLRIVKI